MKYYLEIVFGKEQILKIQNGENLSNEEQEINVKRFSFDTLEEKNAFIKGVNESIGWNECCIPEFEIINYTSLAKRTKNL
jgi:hypothetical protein